MIYVLGKTAIGFAKHNLEFQGSIFYYLFLPVPKGPIIFNIL